MSTTKVFPLPRVDHVGGRLHIAAANGPASSSASEAPAPLASTTSTMDVAAKGLADAFRLFVREAVRDELAGLKAELLAAFRRAQTDTGARSDADATRLLSVAEVASRVGATPATVREWIKDGYLPAVALGPAGRKYAIRWVDVEASLVRRDKAPIGMDLDAEASQIVGAARARAACRKGA
jgi:excisionase family DNA binding protein